MRYNSQIKYLHDCFQADRQGSTLWNVFDQKTEHRMVIEGKERLINGFIPYHSVNAEKGSAAANAAFMYAKEKELVYGSFFITGKHLGADGAVRTLCSPVLLYSASIREDCGDALLSIDLSSRRVNWLLIQALCGDDRHTDDLYHKLLQLVPEYSRDDEAVSTVAELLKACVPALCVDTAYTFPELTDEKQLKSAATERKLYDRV